MPAAATSSSAGKQPPRSGLIPEMRQTRNASEMLAASESIPLESRPSQASYRDTHHSRITRNEMDQVSQMEYSGQKRESLAEAFGDTGDLGAIAAGGVMGNAGALKDRALGHVKKWATRFCNFTVVCKIGVYITPLLVFLLSQMVWTEGLFSTGYSLCTLISFFLLLLIVLAFFGAYTSRHLGPKDFYNRHDLYLLIALSGFAMVLGFIQGLYLAETYFVPTEEHEYLATYDAISPWDSAVSKTDAGTIRFTQAAKVETQNSIGFFAQGKVYCAAPIGEGLNFAQPIQYFAVGENCCGARADFMCGDVLDGDAKTGVVLKQPVDTRGNPIAPTLPIGTDRIKYFQLAIEAGNAAYSWVPAPTYIMVEWSSDVAKTLETREEFAYYQLTLSSFVVAAFTILAQYLQQRSYKNKTKLVQILDGSREIPIDPRMMASASEDYSVDYEK